MKNILFKLSLICLVKCNKQLLIGKTGWIKQFPHSAFLNVMCTVHLNTPGWICGSSIVNQRIILTAAHCVNNCYKSISAMVTITVGHRHRYKGSESSVEHICCHRKFDQTLLIYDIALLKLKSDLKFSQKVRRVALMRNPPPFERARIAGWGLRDVS